MEEHMREDDKEDEDGAEAVTDDEVLPQLLEETDTAQDADDIAVGIVELTKVGVIDKGLSFITAQVCLQDIDICWSAYLSC